MARIGFLLLCGGQSSRMGMPKALLELDGRTLLETVAEAGDGFSERILSVNDAAIPAPKGFVRCADVYPGCGPMAGIHAALRMTQCDALVTAPCDAPYYSAALAQELARQFDPSADALVSVDEAGRLQPLIGVYAKSSIPVLEEHLKCGKLKMRRMLELMRIQRCSIPAGMERGALENLNTPEDVQRFRNSRL